MNVTHTLKKKNTLPIIHEWEENEEVGSLQRRESIKSPSSLRADSLPNTKPYLINTHTHTKQNNTKNTYI